MDFLLRNDLYVNGKYISSWVEENYQIIVKARLFLIKLMKNKYRKTKDHINLVVLVYAHHTLEERNESSYKVVLIDSPDYKKFMSTDDYKVMGNFKDIMDLL